jgi:hypothetical protein
MSTSIAVRRESKGSIVVTFGPETASLTKEPDCAAEFSMSSVGQRRRRRVAKPVEKPAQALDCVMVCHRLWISPGREDGRYRRHVEQTTTQFPSGVKS